MGIHTVMWMWITVMNNVQDSFKIREKNLSISGGQWHAVYKVGLGMSNQMSKDVDEKCLKFL